MMGSPLYYDVLYDEGPGDVVFHDCMWSGICTCCIQLLHQDSLYYSNETPDLKADLMQLSTSSKIADLASSSINNNNSNMNNNNINNFNDFNKLDDQHQLNHYQQQPQHQPLQHLHQQQQHIQQQLLHQQPSGSDIARSASTTSQHCNNHSTIMATNCTNSITTSTINPSSNNSTGSHSSRSSSNSSTSPKPIRRREHNDSERKRRDHLRNAFNFLRDQVPRFKAINKKPPRIQILHEATVFIQRITKESIELEEVLQHQKAEHERLQKL